MLGGALGQRAGEDHDHDADHGGHHHQQREADAQRRRLPHRPLFADVVHHVRRPDEGPDIARRRPQGADHAGHRQRPAGAAAGLHLRDGGAQDVAHRPGGELLHVVQDRVDGGGAEQARVRTRPAAASGTPPGSRSTSGRRPGPPTRRRGSSRRCASASLFGHAWTAAAPWAGRAARPSGAPRLAPRPCSCRSRLPARSSPPTVLVALVASAVLSLASPLSRGLRRLPSRLRRVDAPIEAALFTRCHPELVSVSSERDASRAHALLPRFAVSFVWTGYQGREAGHLIDSGDPDSSPTTSQPEQSGVRRSPRKDFAHDQ